MDFLGILTFYFHFPSDTQSDPDFSIVARVEAFIAGWGLDEALKRSEAYLNAGADAILMHSKKSDPSDIEAFVKAWNNQVHFMIYMKSCCYIFFFTYPHTVNIKCTFVDLYFFELPCVLLTQSKNTMIIIDRAQ